MVVGLQVEVVEVAALLETITLTPHGAVIPGGRAFSKVKVFEGTQMELLALETTKLTPQGTPIPAGKLDPTVIVVVGTHLLVVGGGTTLTAVLVTV